MKKLGEREQAAAEDGKCYNSGHKVSTRGGKREELWIWKAIKS